MAPLKERKEEEKRDLLREVLSPHAAPLWLLAGLFVFLYWGPLRYAFFHGRINPSQSHASVVPLVSILMVWLKRDEWPKGWGEGTRLGYLILLFSFLLHGLGILAEEPRLSLLSMVLALFAYALLLGGLRLAWFLMVPILFFLFLIPYGHVEEGLSRFLRLMATRFGTTLALWTGVNAEINGTEVTIAGSRLQIAAPCSGLRSLSTLLALAVVFAHLMEPSMAGKTILILASLPIAVVGNAIRLGLVLSAAESFGTSFAMKLHDHSGILVFLFAFSCLLGLGRCLEWIRTRTDTGSFVH